VIQFQSNILQNGDFEAYYENDITCLQRPHFWSDSSGDYYISGIYIDDESYRNNYGLHLDCSGHISGELYGFTDWAISDAFEFNDISGEGYLWSVWLKNDIPVDMSGCIEIHLDEYDRDYELTQTSTLLEICSGEYGDWTQFVSGIIIGAPGDDIELDSESVFGQIRMRAEISYGSHYYLDDMRLEGTNSKIIINRGIVTPFDEELRRYQIQQECLGGTIYTRDHRTEDLEYVAEFRGISRAIYDRLVVFLDHKDCQWGHNSFIFIDYDGAEYDIKMVPQTFEHTELVANLFDISFVFKYETHLIPYGGI